MSVVLMYHGLFKGNDTSRIDAEDLPYAVSVENFVAQLDLIAEKRVGLVDANDTTMPEVVITFDDGHISNFDLAMPLLVERGMPAYLFVTGDFVGKRAHFCEPKHLAMMAKNGIEIGSHGMTHKFFDDLSDTEAERELRQSLEQLEQQSEQAVRSISFPGGRYNKRTVEIARSAGYALLFGSQIGTVKRADLSVISPLKRVAIRKGTTLGEFERIISVNSTYYAKEVSKQTAKTLVKRTLGNRLYHGLYKSISAR